MISDDAYSFDEFQKGSSDKPNIASNKPINNPVKPNATKSKMISDKAYSFDEFSTVKKKDGTDVSSSQGNQPLADGQSQLPTSVDKFGQNISPLQKPIVVKTSGGLEIPTDKIPYSNDPNAVEGLQKRVMDGTVNEEDINHLSSSSGKSPKVIDAYIKKGNQAGVLVENQENKQKLKSDLDNTISDYNKHFGTTFNTDEVLGNAEKSAQFLEALKTGEKQKQSLSAKMKAGFKGYEKEAANLTTAQLESPEDFLSKAKKYQSLLTDHVVKQTITEDEASGVPKDVTLQKIAQRTDPKSFQMVQKALTSSPDYSIFNLSIAGHYYDKLIGNDKINAETLNSIKGYADVSYNKSKKQQALDEMSDAYEKGDKIKYDAAQAKYNMVDDDAIYKYPSLVKQQIVDAVNKKVLQEQGLDDKTSPSNFRELMLGYSGGDLKRIMGELGFMDNPKTKDIASSLLGAGNSIFADSGLLTSSVRKFLDPMKELGMSIGDITGFRSKQDIIADKMAQQMYPEELSTENASWYLNMPKTVLNTTSNILGMVAVSEIAGGLGTEAGLGAKASAKLGNYASFGLPSYDQHLKDSYDFIDNDYGRHIYAALGAVTNSELGQFLELDHYVKLPSSVTEKFAKIANGLSEKTISKDLASELIQGTKKDLLKFTKKYATNVISGAATMASFGAADNVLKMMSGDTSTNLDKTISQASKAFTDGMIGMVLLGGIKTVNEHNEAKNSSFKAFTYDLALNHDSWQDVFKSNLDKGLDTEQGYNEKMKVLNTAKASKNALDAAISENGLVIDDKQKKVWVANKTAVSALTDKLESAKNESEKAEIQKKIDALNEQNGKIQKGLKFNDTLEPLNDLYQAQKDYNEAVEEHLKGNITDEQLEAKRTKFDTLHDNYIVKQNQKVSEETPTEETKSEKVTPTNGKGAEIKIPEGKVTPTVEVGGERFYGANHGEAMIKAMEAGKEFIDSEGNPIKYDKKGNFEEQIKLPKFLDWREKNGEFADSEGILSRDEADKKHGFNQSEDIPEGMLHVPVEELKDSKIIPTLEKIKERSKALVKEHGDLISVAQPIIEKINNADYVNEKDLDNAANVLYDLYDKVPEAQHLIEPLISKIENYEFATKTETSTVTEKRAVKVPREVSDKVPVSKNLEQWEGSRATIKDANGKEITGYLKSDENGKYQLYDEEGNKIASIGEKAITDRDITLPSKEDMPSPIGFDKDGNIKSITLQINKVDTEKGGVIPDKQITIEFKNPEKSLDYAIALRAEQIGEVPQSDFDTEYEDFVKEIQVEVPKTIIEKEGEQAPLKNTSNIGEQTQTQSNESRSKERGEEGGKESRSQKSRKESDKKGNVIGGDGTSSSEGDVPPTNVTDNKDTGNADGRGTRIDKASVFEKYGKKFAKIKIGWGELAKQTLSSLADTASRRGSTINDVARGEVDQMYKDLKAGTLAFNEHKVVTAALHLMNLDEQIDSIKDGKHETDKEITDAAAMMTDLLQQQDDTLEVLNTLGSKAGRTLGLFGGIFSKDEKGQVDIYRVIQSGMFGFDIPKSSADLEQLIKDKKISKYNAKRIEPYVKEMEKLQKQLDERIAKDKTEITELSDKEVQQKIKEAFDKGKKEGTAEKKSVANKKKTDSIRDFAKKVRESDTLDKLGLGKSAAPDAYKAGVSGFNVKEHLADMLEHIADGLDKGEELAKLIKDKIDSYKKDFKENFDEVDFMKLINSAISKTQLPSKEETLKKLQAIKETLNADTITKEMVDSGLIKDYVEDIIHDGRTSGEKVMSDAYNELKNELPSLTRQQLNEAYLGDGEFAKEKKSKLDSDVTSKRNEVKRIASKELKVAALEKGVEWHEETDETKKSLIKSEYEKGLDNRLSDLTKERRQAEREIEESDRKQPYDRLKAAKDAVKKSIEKIRNEILAKKRALEEQKKPLDDVELSRLKEVEKSLLDLENKYIPLPIDQWANEKELKKRNQSLVNEISSLNDQINAGQRKIDNKKASVEDSERTKTLREIKKVKQELLDKVAPDLDKIKEKQDAEKQRRQEKLDAINDEIEHVNNEGTIFRKEIKQKSASIEELNKAREDLNQSYIDRGLKRERGDKDSVDAKRAVIGSISDDLNKFQGDITHEALESAEKGDFENVMLLNNLNKELGLLHNSLIDNGQDLGEAAKKAHGIIQKLENSIGDKSLSKKLKDIRLNLEDNWQKSADTISKKRLQKQYDNEIKNTQRKIKSGNYTDIPTTPYSYKKDNLLTNSQIEKTKIKGRLKFLTRKAELENESGWQKFIKWRNTFLTGGLKTEGRVGISGLSKLIVDPLIVTRIFGYPIKFLPGMKSERTSISQTGKGFKGLIEFKSDKEAIKFADSKKAAFEDAIKNTKKVSDNLDAIKSKYGKYSDEYSKYKASKEYQDAIFNYKKAELENASANIYRFIHGNVGIDMIELARFGSTEFDEMMGGNIRIGSVDVNGADKAHYYLSSLNRTHGALKAPSSRRALIESYNKYLEDYQNRGEDLDGVTRQRALNKAYVEYNSGKFNDKTQLVEAVNELKEGWSKPQNSRVKRIISGFLKFALPAAKIGVNIVKHGIDVSTLGAEGWVSYFREVGKQMDLNEKEGKEYSDIWNKFKSAADNIPEAKKAYINKIMSRGLFGAALFLTAGAMYANGKLRYGGQYEEGKKRVVYGEDGTPLEFGQWEIDGHRFGKFGSSVLNHLPEFLSVALLVNSMQVYTFEHDYAGKTGKKKLKGALDSAASTFWSDVNEVSERLPYKSILHPSEIALSALSVPIMENVSEWFDKDSNGNLRPIDKGVGSTIEAGVGLRALAPTDEKKAEAIGYSK